MGINHKSIIISGGGTGGHVYPALAIADAIKEIDNNVSIHFVGAKEKLEMEKVPLNGYSIDGLPISGLNRSNLLANISLPFKIIKSLYLAGKIINKHKPQAVVGVGGYASWAIGFVATQRNIPLILQEQNAFPSLTNRMLAGRAKLVCTAFDGLEKFFKGKPIHNLGNPVRFSFNQEINKKQALETFNLSDNLPTLLVIGGSLGAKVFNDLLENKIQANELPFNLIWQTGKYYYPSIQSRLTNIPKNVVVVPFIDNMNAAYFAADAVLSRAGAISLAELTLVGKATVLVPSPNVTDDHQTHNAKSFQEKDAAIVLRENNLNQLWENILELMSSEELREKLSGNIKSLARPNAAKEIASLIIKTAGL